MGELDGVMGDVFGEGCDSGRATKFRRRRRRQKRRSRAEVDAGTAGLVGPGDRSEALRRLDLRGCGLLTGVLVVLGLIAVVIAISGGADDNKNDAANTRQESSAQTPSGDETEPSSSDETQYFAITFEGGGDRPNVPGATCQVQAPGEVRVTGGKTVDMYLGWWEGNPLGRPVGTLYPSGTSPLGDDGSFGYVVEGGAGIEVTGTINGERVTGEMVWGVEDPPDTWCRYPFSGDSVDASDAREVIPE